MSRLFEVLGWYALSNERVIRLDVPTFQRPTKATGFKPEGL